MKSCFFILARFAAPNGYAQNNDLKLWYNAPADSIWENALPIGNGRMGAMVYGTVATEIIQLNEATLWSGGSNRNHNPLAIVKAVIKSNLGGNLRIRVPNEMKEVNGKALKPATDENSNSFYRTEKTKAPLVSPKAVITAPVLKETFLYDIPTRPGQIVNIIIAQKNTYEKANDRSCNHDTQQHLLWTNDAQYYRRLQTFYP